VREWTEGMWFSWTFVNGLQAVGLGSCVMAVFFFICSRH
jgi:hypothetical protein